MQELTYIEGGKVEWREAPDPTIEGDAQALVRPVAVATCDLDLMVVTGTVPLPGPLPAGHEGVGEVVELGDGVDSVSVGDLVSIPFQVSCGECRNCKRGQTGNCESVGRMATYGIPIGENYGGFLSDLVRVPFADAMLVPVPDGLEPADIASVSDNVPDGWRCVAPQLEAEPGAPVLVCGGGGSIALYATQIALALGAERVDFAGGSTRDREVAERIGANLLDEEFPEWAGRYPITVDFSGTHEGLSCALRSTEPDGHCTIPAIYFEEKTPVPLLAMYTNGINVYTGRVHSRPVMEPILKLVANGRLKPQEVTGETADWGDAAEALAGHRSKLVVTR